MKGVNQMFNLQTVEAMRKLSHLMIKSFNDEKYRLEYQFICLGCNGISINPLFCKYCGYSYCEVCLMQTKESKLKCLCKRSCKINFEHQINHELLKTYYLVQYKSGTSKQTQISYSEEIGRASCRERV